MFAGLTAVIANVVAQKYVECECYNATQTHTQDVCKDHVVRCYNNDSDRLSSCFVLWAINNITGLLAFDTCCVIAINFRINLGESHVQMKGCFTDAACNRSQCIDNRSGQKKMNFCCCTGHMCNSKYQYIPTTTPAPKENINGNQFLCCCSTNL